MVDSAVQAETRLLLEAILKVATTCGKVQDTARRFEIVGMDRDRTRVAVRRDLPLCTIARLELGAFLTVEGPSVKVNRQE